MVFGWDAVQGVSGYHLQWIEVSHGYHKGGCSWIFAKFSHHYSVDGEVNQPMLLILNPPQLKNRGVGLR